MALCFLTAAPLTQPELWAAFVRQADPELISVYCHAKNPSDASDSILSGRVISPLVNTQHGHISLVTATLNLLAAAFDDDGQNAFFVLLSETTIPIVTVDQVAAGLAARPGVSTINYRIAAPGTEHYQRAAAMRTPYRFRDRFFVHDQWVILARRHVQLLLNRTFLEEFEHVFAADEHYFLNALVHGSGTSLDQVVAIRRTFVNWEQPEVRRYFASGSGALLGQTVHPRTYHHLQAATISGARDEGCWFFRKVSPTCDCHAVNFG